MASSRGLQQPWSSPLVLLTALLLVLVVLPAGTTAFVVRSSPSIGATTACSTSSSVGSKEASSSLLNTRSGHQQEAVLASAAAGGRRGSPLAAATVPPVTTRNDTTASGPRLPGGSLRTAPGPRAWPVVGNSFSMVKAGDLSAYFLKLKQRYGAFFTCRLLGSKMYVVCSPELAKEMFGVRLKDMEDRFLFPAFRDIMRGKGIIFANGQEAALNRRLSMPAFHRPDILDNALAVMISTAQHVAEGYASLPVGSVKSLHEEMKSLSLEVVSQACFSLPIGLLDPQSPYKGIDQLIKDEFRFMGETIRFPIPFAHRIGLNPAFNKYRKASDKLSGLVNRIIEERRQSRAQHRAEQQHQGGGGQGGGVSSLPSKDLLDVYLEALELGEGDDDSISNDSIRRNIGDVFLAGSDTTAGTITACLYELQRNATMKEVVLGELRALDLSDPEHVTMAGMQQRLPYLECCVREALRLYPAAAQIFRHTARDTELGGYHVEGDAIVGLSIATIQRDPAVWGPDAHLFRPERWLDSSAVAHYQSSYAWLPFGAGPRICLGLRFALIEIMAVTAVMMKTVDMEPVVVQGEGEALKVSWPTTIKFDDDVPMRFQGARR